MIPVKMIDPSRVAFEAAIGSLLTPSCLPDGWVDAAYNAVHTWNNGILATSPELDAVIVRWSWRSGCVKVTVYRGPNILA
jgi:hypothetical protein